MTLATEEPTMTTQDEMHWTISAALWASEDLAEYPDAIDETSAKLIRETIANLQKVLERAVQ